MKLTIKKDIIVQGLIRGELLKTTLKKILLYNMCARFIGIFISRYRKLDIILHLKIKF